MILADKVVAVHGALAGVPHAFGGAIALAYYAEPRATIDIDVNVFVDADDAAAVYGPLTGIGIASRPEDLTRAQRDGQVRLWWDLTPLDLFFAYDPFHEAARAGAREVPFGTATIPILAAEHLIVCKAVCDRPKDWVDIQAVLADGTKPDLAECLRWLGRIVGDEDPRYNRLAALF
jgi:hypothetical protein